MIRIDLGKSESKKGLEGTFLQWIGKIRTQLGGPKKKLGKDPKKAALIAGVLALALLPHFFVEQFKDYVFRQHQQTMNGLKEKENSIKQEIARYESLKRDKESYEKQKRKITERLRIVRELMESRGAPVNVFDAIGQSLPQKTWLQSIDLRTTPEPSISLSGQAYSNEDVSDYVDKLSENIHLINVTLGAVSTATVNNTVEVKNFVVDATPKGIIGRSIATASGVTPSGAAVPSAMVTNGVNQPTQSPKVSEQPPEVNGSNSSGIPSGSNPKAVKF